MRMLYMSFMRFLLINCKKITLALLVFIALAPEQVSAAKEEKEGEGGTAAGDALPPGAEVTCEANVSYIWKKKPPPPPPIPAQGATAVPTPTPTGDAQPTSSPKEEPTPVEVLYKRIGETGTVELEVKNKLASRLPLVEAEALNDCNRLHANQSSCVATRFGAMRRDYQLFDFGTRKAVLNALTEDCRDNYGDCLSAKSGQIFCFQSGGGGKGGAEQAETPGKKK